MDKLGLLLLTVLGGVAMAVQSPINAALGKRIGALEAGLVSFCTGAILLFILVLLFGKGQFTAVFQAPKWQWIGGSLGAFLVVTMILATPRLGVLVALMAALVGQMLMSTVIDHFGLFSVEATPIGWERILGLVFLLAGMAWSSKAKCPDPINESG